MKTVFWILLIMGITVINTLIITTLVDMIVIGVPFYIWKKRAFEKKYLLKEKNRIDMQKSTECSGFSAAFVLRSLGVEAEGNDMYSRMPGKLRGGAVLPKNLKKILRKLKVPVQYVKGSLNTLKADLCEGKRVIVFLKTRPDKRWLHYVPIVGYDEEHVYIAESLPSLVNCKEEYYNRKLTNTEFLQLWDTRAVYMPFYRYTYLVIENNKKQRDVAS